MSVHVPETMSPDSPASPEAGRRRLHDERLVLTELDPDNVVDHLDRAGDPLNLITFGELREVCPKCKSPHLKLVLRQDRVRMAHLFCAQCASCFDAHYPNGEPALGI